MGSTTFSCDYCCLPTCSCDCLPTDEGMPQRWDYWVLGQEGIGWQFWYEQPPESCWLDKPIVERSVTPADCGEEKRCVEKGVRKVCYACEPVVCCGPNGCSGYCGGSLTGDDHVGCDSDPESVQDGGPCCDNRCIACGDCGEGGEECCNSTEIQSLFDPLVPDAEELALDQFLLDLETYDNPELLHFVMHHLPPLSLSQDKIKFSVLYRAYLLDALAEMAQGAEFYPCFLKHHKAWQVFARESRKAQFQSN